MEKRDASEAFRERLRILIDRSGQSAGAFAKRCAVDRSALSQFLDHKSVRLPRAETLISISTSEGVSVDWLLGVTQDDQSFGEVASMFSIEASQNDDPSLLAKWHQEAAGYKIRYIPSTLPDLLRTKAVTKYEFPPKLTNVATLKQGFSQELLDYSRLPETDMEVVMPLQRLQHLAEGTDKWSGLTRGIRQAQLEQMSKLLDELYPTFRLFLFDERENYSAPFTVFGPKRAAIYIGEMYIVINSVDHIRELTRRFDVLIREASITPDRAAQWISDLSVK